MNRPRSVQAEVLPELAVQAGAVPEAAPAAGWSQPQWVRAAGRSFQSEFGAGHLAEAALPAQAELRAEPEPLAEVVLPAQAAVRALLQTGHCTRQ